QGTLLWAIDRTASAMGRRLLRSWLARPLVELRPIRARQRIIAALLEAADHRQAIAQTVAALPDLERLAGGLAAGRATADSLRELVAAAEQLPGLAAVLQSSTARFLHTVAQLPPEVEAASAAIRATLAPAGAARPIRPGSTPAYDHAVRVVEE